MTCTMIYETDMSKYFCGEVVNTSCYVQNRIPILNKIAYELLRGRRPNIFYFNQYRCTCFILNNKVYLKKFDIKPQKCIFLRYSKCSKIYIMYNSKTNTVDE